MEGPADFIGSKKDCHQQPAAKGRTQIMAQIANAASSLIYHTAGVPVHGAAPLEGNHQVPVAVLPWMRPVCQPHAMSLLVKVQTQIATAEWTPLIIIQQSKLQLPRAVHRVLATLRSLFMGMQRVAVVRQGMHAVLWQNTVSADRDIQRQTLLQQQDAAAPKVLLWGCTRAAACLGLLQQLQACKAAAGAAWLSDAVHALCGKH